MAVPFVNRPPTDEELRKFRLILSPYQDGTGMLATKDGGTLPGWRDFERAVALAFNGIASENKAIFDVRLRDPDRPGVHYGLSCKMRRELDRVDRDGRVTIELSNSARKFWAHLLTKGIDQTNYKEHAFEVGVGLIGLVGQWHLGVSVDRGGNVDLTGSCYLVLSWNTDGWYQLHQFRLALPDPRDLDWYFPSYVKSDAEVVGNHLNGDEDSETIFEWYGESGAQLKYYPRAETAIWASQRFKLEPLREDREQGILYKAKLYFPELWPEDKPKSI